MSLNKYAEENNVHRVLAHSYMVYFVLLLIGVWLDIYFGYKIITGTVIAPIGFFLILLGSILIFWAQKTGLELKKIKDVRMEHFCRGPYCYTRIPTQWGLFFLVLGFGFITNSFFIILFTIIAFLVSKFVFMGKQDEILIGKYGNAYTKYMKSVKF